MAAPTFGGLTGAAFVEGNNVTSTPVSVASTLTVADDGLTLASATVTVSLGTLAQDTLAFTANAGTMGNIALDGSYNAGTGVLSLISAGMTATAAEWQAALRAVTYTNSSDTPDTTMRRITFSIIDDEGLTGGAFHGLDVFSTPDTPTLTGAGTTTAFTEGANVTSTPVVVSTTVTTADVDSTTLSSATVTVTGGTTAQDTLAFTGNGTTMGNVAFTSYAGGVLTMTSAGGTATKAQWDVALRSVTYTNSSDTPDVTSRTVSFVVNDGSTNSSAVTQTVSVTAANDTPTLSGAGGSTAFTEGVNVTSTPVVVASGITTADVDSPTLASATVTITGGLQTAEDSLAFTNIGAMGNIAGGYTPGTGVLALSSAGATATKAEWDAALRAVTYTNSSDTPNTSSRTVSFVVNDGSTNSATVTQTVTVAAANDAPTMTGAGATPAFTEGNNVTSTPVVVSTTVAAADADSATLLAGRVTVLGGTTAQDVLGFTANAGTMGDIHFTDYSSTTGILNLNSDVGATPAQWTAALRAVTYTNTSESPDTSPRSVTFFVADGFLASGTVSQTVSITAVNDTPTLTGGAGNDTAFVEGANVTSTPVVVASGITTADVDSTTLATATVTVSGGITAQDVLGRRHGQHRLHQLRRRRPHHDLGRRHRHQGGMGRGAAVGDLHQHFRHPRHHLAHGELRRQRRELQLHRRHEDGDRRRHQRHPDPDRRWDHHRLHRGQQRHLDPGGRRSRPHRG